MWLSGSGEAGFKRVSEVPGQEFLYAIDGVVGNLGQDVAEIELRVEAV